MLELPPIDKVSIVGIAKQIETEHKTSTISELASKLEVSLMSESRNRPKIVDKLLKKEPEIVDHK